MRMYATSEFNWKNNKLYLGKKNTGYSVIPHPEPNNSLFWIKYPDGEKSGDFYNLTRAKDNCVKLVATSYNNDTKNGLQV